MKPEPHSVEFVQDQLDQVLDVPKRAREVQTKLTTMQARLDEVCNA